MKIRILAFLSISIVCQLTFAQVGTLDNTFDTGSGANTQVKTIAIQADGKILIGGGFTIYDGTSINRLARINSDGIIDNTFSIGTGPSGTVNKIKVLPDEKIFVVGSISTYNGVDSDFIVKLNSDGSKDTSFTIVHNSNTSSSASDLYVLPDGKILLVGGIIDFNGTGINYFVKLNANGSLDTSFNQGSGFNASINAIDVQSDGRIIVGGSFTEYNGQTARYVARLHPNGSLDDTFNTGELGPSNKVTAIHIFDNDKILLGGSFGSYNGTSTNHVIRLDPNGALELSFDQGISSPREMIIQSNDKVVVSGPSTSFNGGPSRSLVRHNADGTIDTAFNTGMGAGPNGALHTCALQEDGQILIGGSFSFTKYDGVTTNRIARVNGDSTLDSSDIILNNEFKIHPNPTQESIQITSRDTYSRYDIYTVNGKKIRSGLLTTTQSIPVHHLDTGIYIVKLYGTHLNQSFRFVKE